MNPSDRIRQRIKAAGARFNANDNISKYIQEGEVDELINELNVRFDAVLDSLVIDRENDPNSHDTGRRLAKMYVKELMSGRYVVPPKATAFPNDSEDRYEGMLELSNSSSHPRVRG